MTTLSKILVAVVYFYKRPNGVKTPSSGRLGPFYNQTERTENLSTVTLQLRCGDFAFFLNNRINNRIKKLIPLCKKLILIHTEIQWWKDGLFNEWFWAYWIAIWTKKMNLSFYLTP